MPTYQVQLNGNNYEIEAPDDDAVRAAVAQLHAQTTGADSGPWTKYAPAQAPASPADGPWNKYRGDASNLSLDQQKAIALANARLRLQRQQDGKPWDNDPIVRPANPTFGDRFDSNLNASASGFASGIPIIGPAFNEGLNRAEAGVRTLWDGDKSYQQELADVHARESADIASNPGTHRLAEVGGAIEGTAPAMMAAPGLFGLSGGLTLGNVGLGAVTGAAIGGTDSAVRSGLDPKQTAIGAAAGGFGGVAGPLAGKAIGAGVRYLTAPSDAMSSFSRPAQAYLQETMGNPDKVAALRDALMRLGPDATLADVSPEWMGVARGAASQPGNRDAIVQPLLDRSAAANTRIRADIDANLGPAQIPSQIEAGLAGNRTAVAEGYGPVMADARAVDTQPIADRLDALTTNLRGPSQEAIRRVRGYLNIPGTNVLDPDPQALHATREAIDTLMEGEQNARVIGQLSMARQQVDQALAAAAPGIKGVDAQYSELARQSAGLRQGATVLDQGKTAIRPEELQTILQDGALPQGQLIGPSAFPTRIAQGARADIDRAIGTESNDVNALRKTVRSQGDWNRDKLGMLFGQENADRALDAIDRESVFANTSNRVTAGSDTAMAQRFGDYLDKTTSPTEIKLDTTMTGLGIGTAHKVLRAALEDQAEKMGSRFAGDLGRMAVAQGGRRDELVRALTSRTGLRPTDPRIAALVNAMTQGSMSQLSR